MNLRSLILVSLMFAVAGCGGSEPGTDPTQPRLVAAEDSPADASRGPLWRGDAVSCVESYSPTAAAQHAFAFDGTVASVDSARSNRPGKGKLDLVAVTFTVHEWFVGGAGPTVIVDMPAPGDQSGDEQPAAYTLGTRLLISGEPRWGGAPLDDAIAWGCGFSRYYDETTAEEWRAAATG